MHMFMGTLYATYGLMKIGQSREEVFFCWMNPWKFQNP